MTPQEISKKADELERELRALASDPIGYDDYKSQLHRYQILLLGVIQSVQELAKLAQAALAAPTDHLPMD